MIRSFFLHSIQLISHLTGPNWVTLADGEEPKHLNVQEQENSLLKYYIGVFILRVSTGETEYFSEYINPRKKTLGPGCTDEKLLLFFLSQPSNDNIHSV